jgi:nitroreductase
MSDSLGLLEGMATTRSIRRFKPDPIPDDLLRSVLEAATWAPSGSNTQNWRLLVVRDAEKRRQVGELYREGFFDFYPAERLASETDPSRVRMMTGAVYLAENLGIEPPVLVIFCQARPTDPTSKSPSSVRPWTRGSSIYPAVQNLLLAARASGLGGCLTTVHLLHEQKLRSIFGIPDEIDTFALVPLGFPRDKFGPLRRQAVDAVGYLDGWGSPLALDR